MKVGDKMENSFKALIMAASVLLFVIAVSIAMYTYSTLMATTDLILTNSESFAMSSESYTVLEQDTTRKISAAEVVGTIMSLQSKNGYIYNKVIVGTNEFKSGDIYTKNNAIKTILNMGGDYSILSEDYDNKVITYQKN